MATNDKNSRSSREVAKAAELVVRSDVEPGLEYREYLQPLRYDFFYACAYCNICETEAQAIRFTIDHYEPQKSRPDLVDAYNNLMYCCTVCNERKGDRSPPESARVESYRFFRPDQDIFHLHFEMRGIRLMSKSNIGTYTIEALDLNRAGLRKLRQIRERLTNCDQLVAEGIRGLLSFPIDRLPKHIRGKAAFAIQRATHADDALGQKIDALLRDYARSALIDPDPDTQERIKARKERLKHIEGLHPGAWRAPRSKKVR